MLYYTLKKWRRKTIDFGAFCGVQCMNREALLRNDKIPNMEFSRGLNLTGCFELA